MEKLLKEAQDMVEVLGYCSTVELCDECRMHDKCCTIGSDFVITMGAAKVIEKLMDALRACGEKPIQE